jgi:hypothetical protein
MMLPKVSGLDILWALKGDVVEHIPVIVLSGFGQANETKLISEEGMRRLPRNQILIRAKPSGEKAESATFVAVLRSLSLTSLDQLGNLKTVHEIVTALEA